ncbi:MULTISPECIES: iron ABC transporter permease [Enterobacteriaceae]|uniref:FecCD family ABC transporter permease n=1 Tax=Enterobacteriaceae TaxID=543 RepID=UPI0012AE078B|nr:MULTISPECIES: iron ABC transporter permease [Enterobacteriaceae]MRT51276.1 iron chelate uptake ABC transporter family permease subunit [Raoultella sp. RIT712]QNK08646.1 iron ABC transporter permease [Enterobacter sp. JUb54]
MRSNRHSALLQSGLALTTLVIALASLCVGQYHLSPAAVITQLTQAPPGDGIAGQIVWSVRLPRVVMALLAGGALGLCGATLQGVFQNPLVDPHIIGVTSGSAFGGTLAILLGLDTLLMMASTFGFGLLALMLVYLIAALQGRENTLVLILSGIVLSGFFAALVSLMQYLADSEETLPNIVFWLLGSFATANWHKVAMMAPPILITAAILLALRWRINLLALDEKDARGLGVPVTALRRGVLVCCAVLVAAQVAVSGSIAWVGLVIPHLARLLVGADHRRLLPTAFCLGGGFMIVVDDLARSLTQAEVPVGIITALLGAPLFTWLLVQSRRRSAA